MLRERKSSCMCLNLLTSKLSFLVVDPVNNPNLKLLFYTRFELNLKLSTTSLMQDLTLHLTIHVLTLHNKRERNNLQILMEA